MKRVTPLVSPKQSSPRSDNEPFSSPLLHEALSRYDRTTRQVIFEPGAISSGILALLEGSRCRLLVADAAVSLSELDAKSHDEGALSRGVKKLIIDPGTEKIDTVLCWDLLNYLSLPLLGAFAANLAAIMSPEGMMHAYIHSADSNMPQRPQRYALLEDDLVVRLDRDPAERKVPRYSYGDLEKHMTELQVARSMLLRNGMQEYLLRVKPF